MEMSTRKPKKKFKLGALIRNIVLPVAAIGALAGAIAWPPSHKIIFEGPLKPMLEKAAPVADQLGRPLHFVAQQQAITEKNRQIQALDAQVEQSRKDLAGRDDQIKTLQAQLNAARNPAGASANAAPQAPAAVSAGAAQTVASAGSPGQAAAEPAVDPNVKRTATIWSQMDADAVAGLAQKLPLDYVVQVLGQMAPDAVGQVMEALPPDVAAKITQARSGH